MEIKNTCQICAREIKAKNGIIAHHGFKRPGGGWQTQSCYGARYLPYEVSCDRIPDVIEIVKNYIKNQEEWVVEFLKNPPDELRRERHWGEYVTYTRPENFNTKEALNRGGYSGDQMYDLEFTERLHRTEREIKQAKRDLQTLEERLVNWKQAREK